jgi:hypothetical protein
MRADRFEGAEQWRNGFVDMSFVTKMGILTLAAAILPQAAVAQTQGIAGATTRRQDPAVPLVAPQSTRPSSGSPADEDRNFRFQVMSDCEVQAWQFSVATQAGKYLRVQVSPTLSPEIHACIDKEVTLYRAQVEAE